MNVLGGGWMCQGELVDVSGKVGGCVRESG